MKPTILSLLTDRHRKTVFRDEVWEQINAMYTVTCASSDQAAESALADASAVLTGWGTSFVFTPARLRSAKNLRIIAHTAGSVKPFFPDHDARELLLRREIIVFSGVEGMAANVAEAAVGLLILAMRRWPELSNAFPGDPRIGLVDDGDCIPRNGRFLRGATIGLVGLSTVARKIIPLLKAFDCRILAYDPFVSAQDASRLGVQLIELDELFRRCDAVSLHAPALPATRHMIGATQLRLLRDGATLVNTARGMLLDHDALYDECRTGRISVALDVTDPEPLPAGSPLLGLPNVYVLPHVAGLGHAGLFQIGDDAFEALNLALSGDLVPGAVPLQRWESIA
ncbi:MAG: hydroxyacid dehydrogenase [Capsulimonadaceae bacterium]|nr:hydroxyacid dehydrogenase [Capsulimonadaceae bacterium]